MRRFYIWHTRRSNREVNLPLTVCVRGDCIAKERSALGYNPWWLTGLKNYQLTQIARKGGKCVETNHRAFKRVRGSLNGVRRPSVGVTVPRTFTS